MADEYSNRVPTNELERLIVVGVKLGVNDALNEHFASIGVNRADIHDMEEFKADQRFIRALRKRPGIWDDLKFVQTVRTGSASAGRRFGYIILGVMATAFCLGMGQVLRDWAVFWITGKYPTH